MRSAPGPVVDPNSWDPIPPTVAWVDGTVRLIDQRALPHSLAFVSCTEPDEVVTAISSLVVRGAPALGATAAYGVALAATNAARGGAGPDGVLAAVRDAAARLTNVRPTAVNLARGAAAVFTAVERAASAHETTDSGALAGVALAAADDLAARDVAVNRAIGAHGAALVRDGARVLTHCNAGALACVGYGTALGVIRAAAESGRRVSVWVDETRPVLQGARLTAWELDRLGIATTVIADVMAASLLRAGEVDLVVVGADRIAANGDVANKIGTYPLAVLAARHGVPFYVAAPVSTIDSATTSGDDIVIEERAPDEVLHVAGVRTAPDGIKARNLAFDVTPSELITGIVTEHGILRAPYDLCADGMGDTSSEGGAPTALLS